MIRGSSDTSAIVWSSAAAPRVAIRAVSLLPCELHVSLPYPIVILTTTWPVAGVGYVPYAADARR